MRASEELRGSYAWKIHFAIRDCLLIVVRSRSSSSSSSSGIRGVVMCVLGTFPSVSERVQVSRLDDEMMRTLQLK
jgi:hypothetical protein